MGITHPSRLLALPHESGHVFPPHGAAATARACFHEGHTKYDLQQAGEHYVELLRSN
jgi:hypothetical protein